MGHNLLDYLASAASIRANDFAALQSHPATPLDDIQQYMTKSIALNHTLGDLDDFARAISLTPTVQYRFNDSKCFLIFDAISRTYSFSDGYRVDASHN